MPNDMTRLLATVSAMGLSLGVSFAGAAAAEPPATAAADSAPAADAAARTSGYDLKMAKKQHDEASEKRLVAVKMHGWKNEADAAAAPGGVTHADSWDAQQAKTGMVQKGREHKADPDAPPK